MDPESSHLFKDDDFFGAVRTFRLMETKMNINLIIVWAWKSYQIDRDQFFREAVYGGKGFEVHTIFTYISVGLKVLPNPQRCSCSSSNSNSRLLNFIHSLGERLTTLIFRKNHPVRDLISLGDINGILTEDCLCFFCYHCRNYEPERKALPCFIVHNYGWTIPL